VVDHRGDMMRWYNPALGGFEWREVPESDEEALSALEGSPFTPQLHKDLPGVARFGRGHHGGAHPGGRGGQRRPDA
jgi:hypothetical protein